MPKPKLMGTNDVARMLKVSQPTVRKYADLGLLPVQWTGSGRRIYTEVGVQQFVARREAAKHDVVELK